MFNTMNQQPPPKPYRALVIGFKGSHLTDDIRYLEEQLRSLNWKVRTLWLDPTEGGLEMRKALDRIVVEFLKVDDKQDNEKLFVYYGGYGFFRDKTQYLWHGTPTQPLCATHIPSVDPNIFIHQLFRAANQLLLVLHSPYSESHINFPLKTPTPSMAVAKQVPIMLLPLIEPPSRSAADNPRCSHPGCKEPSLTTPPHTQSHRLTAKDLYEQDKLTDLEVQQYLSSRDNLPDSIKTKLNNAKTQSRETYFSIAPTRVLADQLAKGINNATRAESFHVRRLVEAIQDEGTNFTILSKALKAVSAGPEEFMLERGV